MCGGSTIVARWSYVLDTSDDEYYSFVSYGQLLLRGDGRVFQRVYLSGHDEYGPWNEAGRAPGAGPYTVEDVHRLFGMWNSSYMIRRI